MGELEAIGDAVTGGAIARAVEPKAGEAADGHTRDTNCLNCGAVLTGTYCHQCGQHAHVHRTLSAFFHDFLHGVLHFEGKIWRTLPLLVWRPGELTRRYIDGQRARFLSPVALFLFCVFLMFAAVSLFGGNMGELPAAAKEELRAELHANQLKLATLERQKSAEQKIGRKNPTLDEQISDLRSEIEAEQAVQQGNFSKRSVRTSGDLPDWLNDSIGKAARNPELLAYKLKTNAYKFSWLIIPLSVPFVWLLFPFSRRFRLYDHTVFVTYSLCFMSLLVIFGVIFGVLGLGGIAIVLWLVPPFHMYRQLKGAYGIGRFSALWRTVLLTLFALIVISVFAAVLVGMGTFE